MKIQYFKPNNILNKYIERYWSWESDDNNISLPKIIPGTGVELIFHYDAPFIYENIKPCCSTSSNSNLICSRHDFIQLKNSGKIGFISIRFRSGAFRHFCDIPAAELIDTIYDAGEIWGHRGSEFETMVIEVNNTNNRIKIIEDQLMKLLALHGKDNLGIDYAINKIYYDYKTVNLAGIGEEINISTRHFQRNFKKAIGVTPKYFHRLSRFQTTLKHLLLDKKRQYLHDALDNGFYDQSHFINEFKCFVGEEPLSFLQKANFRSHFYNTKLFP